MKIVITLVLLAAATATASTTCQNTFSKGANATLVRFCVTENGNIGYLESPLGAVQLNGREGYMISIPGHCYADVGTGDSGNWGAAVIVQPHGPNTMPLTVTRMTQDGLFTLQQDFAYTNSNKALKVTLTLTNTLPGNQVITLRRYADVQGNSGETGDGTIHSSFVWDGVNGFGLLASAVPFPGVAGQVARGGVNDLCVDDYGIQTPPYRGDSATVLNWGFTSRGKTKVSFTYNPIW